MRGRRTLAVRGTGTRRRLFGGVLGTALTVHAAPALAQRAPRADGLSDYVGWVDVPRYFPETEHNVDGDFLPYFWHGGGPDTFGFPLTEEFWTAPDEGAPAGRMVQYFQRARLEYDLGEAQVHRSLLGRLLEKEQPAVPPAPGVRYFLETGHNVGSSFLVHFENAGGREVLGLPISEEVEENGRPVQWFERARLEWWPENLAGRRVQYGLIGEAHLNEVEQQVPLEARRPAAPLPPVRDWSLPAVPPAPRVAWAPRDVPILYYHQVPSQQPLREQIQAFQEAGREIVPLSRVVATLRAEPGADLPEKPLVLTFDDGWVSQIQNAAPVLQAEKAPATFFVITRYLGELPGYMSWDQVRTIKELGHEVESHTQNHPDLDRLYDDDEGAALAEIWESLAVLERRLGRSRRIFAYPNGRLNQAVTSLTARVYQAAVATGGGTFQSQQHLYTMRRIKAEPHYKPEALLKLMG